MTNYIFILGRNHELSLLELISYLKKEGINYKTSKLSKEILIASINKFNSKKAIKSLGGTVKMGEEVEDINEIYTGTKNKITFAVNHYNVDPTKVALILKNIFKELKIKATHRFTKSKNIEPSKSKNLDLEIIAYKNRIFKVVESSNPKEYKERDEKRPKFDPLKVTSIRLAKILINLSQAKEEILDPFCGNGTILQEALLIDLKCRGSDVDISDANKNLIWLESKYSKVKNNWKLFQCDAKRISDKIKLIEAVVTEPYLGPYYKRPPSKSEAMMTAKKLKTLYRNLLKELYKIVKNKVVIIVPMLKTKERTPISLNFDKILKEERFRSYSPLKNIGIPLEYTDNQSNIRRFIYILEKN